MFLEISQNSQENTCARTSFLKLQPQTCNFIQKETLAQVFACEFCEISKNTFFTEHLWTTATVTSRLKRLIRLDSNKYTVLLTDPFRNPLWQKTRLSIFLKLAAEPLKCSGELLKAEEETKIWPGFSIVQANVSKTGPYVCVIT